MHVVGGERVLLKPTEALQDFLDARAGFQAAGRLRIRCGHRRLSGSY
jgi:hypothetical protein